MRIASVRNSSAPVRAPRAFHSRRAGAIACMAAAAGWILPPPAAAQRPPSARRHEARASTPAVSPPASPPRGAVVGTVFDSLAGAPLPGATIVIEELSRFARTDSAGSFRFDTLPAGKFSLAFAHPSLDSIDITLPSRRVDVGAEAPTSVSLAVPSGHTLLVAICPPARAADSTGIVMGVVRDAVTNAPVADATVVFSWDEYLLGKRSVKQVRRTVAAKTASDGSYHACGIPANLGVRTHVGTDSASFVEARVAPDGFARLDLLHSGGMAPGRGASVAGHVQTKNGATAAGAIVQLVGDPRKAVSDSAGDFRLLQLSPGTRTIEARLIGFAPERTTVALRPGDTSRVTITLGQNAVVLKEIAVSANADRAQSGFEYRRKHNEGGYFVTEEQLEHRGVSTVTDLFRGIPGIEVIPLKGGDDYTVVSGRTRTLEGACLPVIYVDAYPWPGDMREVNRIVRRKEVIGIEVYPSATDVPQAYGGGSARCGAILIWTRRSLKKVPFTDTR